MSLAGWRASMGMTHHEFTGALSARDAKRHLAHPFDVPPGASELQVELWHAEGLDGGLANMLTLTLFDPAGFRGAGHRMGLAQDGGRVHRVMLRADSATPGYRPGPLPPGRWTAVIDAHRVTAAGPCAYRLSVTAWDGAEVPPPAESASAAPPLSSRCPRRRAAGWFRGDLHAHSWHSDGHWTERELADWARGQGLDFVSLTDHNTVSGLAALSAADSLVLGGMELTTFHGHAVALGAREWVDWRTGSDVAPRAIADVAAQVEAMGGLFVIAHPMAVGDPACTGCDWTHADMMPGAARAVEVWNGGLWEGVDSNNEQSLALYYRWLNQGHRLVATAGTDAHGSFAPGARPGFNRVYARSLSEPDVLDAIRQGHVCLSSGPRVALTARGGSGQAAMMGDAIPPGPVRIQAAWRGCAPGCRAVLVLNGEPIHTWPADGDGRGALSRVLERGQWTALELRGRDGELAALANPIFAR
jgi:hypothetical protein